MYKYALMICNMVIKENKSIQAIESLLNSLFLASPMVSMLHLPHHACAVLHYEVREHARCAMHECALIFRSKRIRKGARSEIRARVVSFEHSWKT